MALRRAKGERSARVRQAPQRRYHHGNLREALIEAVVHLVERNGVENLTVREAARRAGVSSGAPFRHFPNKIALMTAVAEEAMRDLRAEVERAVAKTAGEDPLTRFRAIGTAYLRWALGNPTRFQIISTRSWIDFEGSPSLRRDNDAMRAVIKDILDEARGAGQLRPGSGDLIAIAGRALVYGLARMQIDGHFPSWDVSDRDTKRVSNEVLDLFVSGLESRRWQLRPSHVAPAHAASISTSTERTRRSSTASRSRSE